MEYEARLHTRLHNVTHNTSGCIVWQGTTNKGGYGLIGVRHNGGGQRTALVHRVVFALHFGLTLTADMHILHLCHNPACCNIDHLAMGTNRANQFDQRR